MSLDVRIIPASTDTPEYRLVEAGTHVYETDYFRGGGKRGRGHGIVKKVRYQEGKGLLAVVRYDRVRGLYTMTARRAGKLKVDHDVQGSCHVDG